MKYFALQVKTRSEEKFLAIYRSDNPDTEANLYFPKMAVKERRRGHIVKKVRSIFPGYVFLALDDKDNITGHCRAFSETEGFFRFLPSNTNIRSMKGRDLELITRIIGIDGQVIGVPKVYFDENDHIVIIDGPFQGFEGKIVKVDKRKQRARVVLDLYGESHPIDISFDVVKKTISDGSAHSV
jgi:transcriptional antiterminator NusG